MPRAICTARHSAGQRCALLDDHTNGRHIADDGTVWPDRLVILRRLRRTARIHAERRALRRAGLLPLVLVAAAALAVGALLAVPTLDTACVDAGANLYGSTRPDRTVDVAGYGLAGLNLAHARGGLVVYRQCSGATWVPAPAASWGATS